MDPLRPFLALVRSLSTGATSSKNARDRQSAPSSSDQATEITIRTVEQRLQAELAVFVRAWNSQRAREVFVGRVLLHELGENLSADPAFSELIQRVSSQLGSDPRLSARLDELLQQLAGKA
jgi:hypothetical protein